MWDRRRFVQGCSLLVGAAIMESSMAAQHGRVGRTAQAASVGDVTKYVNVFVGTGGHGHTYPGATVPFGAVQLSPDTGNTGWDWCSGYHHSDTSIMGFSHTHLSGTGCGDLLDFLVVPRMGEVRLVPGDKRQFDNGYRTRFSHDDEHAEPGYYAVKLASGIVAELTATERVGVHRYTFPAGEAHLLLDLVHAYDSSDDRKAKQPVEAAEIRVAGPKMLLGGRHSHGWTAKRQLYFAMVFEQPFTRVQLYRDREAVEGTEVQGKTLHAAIYPGGSGPVVVKVGISMVSAENALANVQAEAEDVDFNTVRAAAKSAWQRELSTVAVDSYDVKRKTIFYSSLYHTLCAPTLADDSNGQYRGMDGEVHTLEAGEHNYSTYSLWDTFRALHPSFTLWQPERVGPMVMSLVRMAEESPAGIPIWPLQGGETFCMTGYHSSSVMAEACAKGFPGIDWKRAYAVMRKRNMDDDYQGLAYYRELGYIPADKTGESVSKALEYCYNDWACAHVADATGNSADAVLQRRRSQNYRNLFDGETKFIRAKLANGQWAPNFDPRATGHTKKYRDYTESNAWQTTFFVQHDAKGYIDLFGGREAFTAKLDALFTAAPGVSNEEVVDMSGFIGQYVHGNEPSHAILYLYTFAGQPWKTQQRVREVLDTLYRNDFDGLSGNEDCGQMSAWYVMSTLGLYAVDPVSATYVLTAPAFDRVRVHVGEGRELLIEATRSAPSDVYIQSVALNGKPLDRLWVRHDELARGAHLQFVLGPSPNLQLGTDPALAPPSLTA